MESRPKSAHRYNVQEQQDVYKEEIRRIWKAQYEALSNPVEPMLTEEDEERQRGRRSGGPRATAAETPYSNAGTPYGGAGTPGSRGSSPDKEDGMSVASGRGAPYGQNKVLRIKRLVSPRPTFFLIVELTRGACEQINGVWETEIVREPTIIGAYVRQRQTIDEEKGDADELLLSDDEGKNERRKKRFVSPRFPLLVSKNRTSVWGGAG